MDEGGKRRAEKVKRNTRMGEIKRRGMRGETCVYKKCDDWSVRTLKSQSGKDIKGGVLFHYILFLFLLTSILDCP